MPTLNSLYQSDIRFLDVRGGALDEASYLSLQALEWGAENGAAIAVGIALGFAVGWARGRVAAAYG